MSKKVIYHRKAGDTRQVDDFYATCPTTIPPLLKLLDWEGGGKTIWENSCGQGHLSEALKMFGHTVISTDLIDRGYGQGGVDFLDPAVSMTGLDGIIMNPPYKHARAFIEKSITLAPVVAAFLRIAFLESQGRRAFFEQHPPHTVAVFSERAQSAKDGDFDNIGAGVQCYAWFIWRKGWCGHPSLRWI